MISVGVNLCAIVCQPSESCGAREECCYGFLSQSNVLKQSLACRYTSPLFRHLQRIISVARGFGIISKMSVQAERSLRELRLNTLAGSICTATSVALTNPLDTLRVRWQISGNNVSSQGLIRFGTRIIRTEGLFQGLWFPGCAIHMAAVSVSSGIRLGFYPAIRDILAAGETKNAVHMGSAGFIAGAIGFWLANPLFQAKIRVQASMANGSAKPLGASTSLRNTLKSEGILGLYRGSGILMARGALLSSGAQLGYDYVKTLVLKKEVISDGPALHFISSISSAILAVTFCTPADLVLTKYQSAASLGIRYNGVADCIKQTIASDGIVGLYKGWVPLFARVGPLFVINMPMYEQCRRLLGLSYMK